MGRKLNRYVALRLRDRIISLQAKAEAFKSADSAINSAWLVQQLEPIGMDLREVTGLVLLEEPRPRRDRKGRFARG